MAKSNIIVDEIIRMYDEGKMTAKEAGKALAKNTSAIEKDLTKEELDHFQTFKKYYYKQAEAEIIRRKYEVDKSPFIKAFEKMDTDLQISKASSTKAERRKIITDAFMDWMEVDNG